MAKTSSFTDEERGAWYEDRHREKRRDTGAGTSLTTGNNCINCGNPLGYQIPDGYEAALCGACD